MRESSKIEIVLQKKAIAGYIQQGADGNHRFVSNETEKNDRWARLTPLCCAVGLGNVDLFNALLAQKSIDCNVLDGVALDLAVYLEWSDIVETLKAGSTRKTPNPIQLKMHFNYGNAWEIMHS